MQRIRFRDTDQSNVYTVPINPNQIDVKDNDLITLQRTLDGMPVRFKRYFDDRVHTLIWPALPNSNTTFQSLLSELKSYKGLNKQVHLGDLDYLSWGWRNINITNVTSAPIQGGSLRYSITVEFVFLDRV